MQTSRSRGWLDFEPAADGRFLAVVVRSIGTEQPLTWVSGWRPTP